MGKVLIDESTLTDIADSIRSKKGTTSLINPANYAQEISGIKSGGGTAFNNGFTVNFYNKNEELIESHSAKSGMEIYAPASYLAQYWTDKNDVTYVFPFTCEEDGMIFDLYHTGAGICETMIYEKCGVSKEEYPYVVLKVNLGDSTEYKSVSAIFFKEYYINQANGYLNYGASSSTSAKSGYLSTDNSTNNKYVTSTENDIVAATREFFERETDYTLTKNNGSSFLVHTNASTIYYSNIDWNGNNNGDRLDIALYTAENKYHPYSLQEKTVTENGEVVADEGYYGLSKVIVNI